MKRPCGVAFGFGGRLASFSHFKQQVTDPATGQVGGWGSCGGWLWGWEYGGVQAAAAGKLTCTCVGWERQAKAQVTDPSRGPGGGLGVACGLGVMHGLGGGVQGDLVGVCVSGTVRRGPQPTSSAPCRPLISRLSPLPTHCLAPLPFPGLPQVRALDTASLTVSQVVTENTLVQHSEVFEGSISGGDRATLRDYCAAKAASAPVSRL